MAASLPCEIGSPSSRETPSDDNYERSDRRYYDGMHPSYSPSFHSVSINLSLEDGIHPSYSEPSHRESMLIHQSYSEPSHRESMLIHCPPPLPNSKYSMADISYGTIRNTFKDARKRGRIYRRGEQGARSPKSLLSTYQDETGYGRDARTQSRYDGSESSIAFHELVRHTDAKLTLTEDDMYSSIKNTEHQSPPRNAILCDDDTHPVNYDSSPQTEIHSIYSTEPSITGLSSFEEPNAATLNFVNELASQIVKECIASESRGIKGYTGYQDEGSNSSSCSNQLGTPGSSQQSSLKRRQPSDGGGDPDSGNDKNNFPHKYKQKRVAAKSMRLFACPYAKFDPERYSERNCVESIYRKCNSHRLTGISRVKQHLERAHKRPNFYCGRCFEQFEKREQFHEHQNQELRCNPQPTRFEERMTDEQFEKIKTQRLENNRASWFRIYRILFKDAAEPASPYVSTCDHNALHHFTRFFVWYGADIINLVHDRMEKDGSPPDLNVSLQALIEETFEIAFPDYEQQLEQRRKRLCRERQAIECGEPDNFDDLLGILQCPLEGSHDQTPWERPSFGGDTLPGRRSMGIPLGDVGGALNAFYSGLPDQADAEHDSQFDLCFDSVENEA